MYLGLLFALLGWVVFLANAAALAGPPLFLVSRSNYVGVYGTEEIEDAPGDGNGVFFYHSRIRFADMLDGQSTTLMVGERSSRLGGSNVAGPLPSSTKWTWRVAAQFGSSATGLDAACVG